MESLLLQIWMLLLIFSQSDGKLAIELPLAYASPQLEILEPEFQSSNLKAKSSSLLTNYNPIYMQHKNCEKPIFCTMTYQCQTDLSLKNNFMKLDAKKIITYQKHKALQMSKTLFLERLDYEYQMYHQKPRFSKSKTLEIEPVDFESHLESKFQFLHDIYDISKILDQSLIEQLSVTTTKNLNKKFNGPKKFGNLNYFRTLSKRSVGNYFDLLQNNSQVKSKNNNQNIRHSLRNKSKSKPRKETPKRMSPKPITRRQKFNNKKINRKLTRKQPQSPQYETNYNLPLKQRILQRRQQQTPQELYHNYQNNPLITSPILLNKRSSKYYVNSPKITTAWNSSPEKYLTTLTFNAFFKIINDIYDCSSTLQKSYSNLNQFEKNLQISLNLNKGHKKRGRLPVKSNLIETVKVVKEFDSNSIECRILNKSSQMLKRYFLNARHVTNSMKENLIFILEIREHECSLKEQ